MAHSHLQRALALATALLGVSCASLFPPVDEGVLTLGPLGGRFTFGPVTVTVPAGAVTTDHTVSISEATGTPDSPRLVGATVTVTLTPPDTLLVPATVEFRYTDFVAPPRIPRASLLLHDVENGSWVSAGGTNDAGAAIVSAQVTRLGVFALLGRRAETVQAQSATAQPAQPNAPIANPPSVIVRDSAGGALEGITVTFAVTAGGGSITPTSTVTNASGIATATSWTSGPSAGANEATASVTELPSVTFTTTPASGAPVESSVAANAGDNQTAMVGAALATRPSIIVQDQNNAPFAGASVTFAVTSGGGTVIGATQTTGSNGIATVGSWTLGTQAGTNTLSASVARTGVAGNPVTFTATALAGAAGSLVISTGNGQVGTVGAAVATPPSVRVVDQFGNPIAGAAVVFAPGIGGGTVTGASQSTGPTGIATVGSWTLGGTSGTQTLNATVSATGISGNPVTVTATAQPGAPSSMAAKGGLGQSAIINTPVTIPPSVLVTDQFGNPVAGVTVTFGVAAGAGTLAGANKTTGLDGIAQVGSWTLGPDAGLDSLTATSAGLTGSPVLFTANAVGTASSIWVNDGNLQTATAGTAVAVPPSALVLDQANNPVRGTAVTFTVTGGGGSILGGSQTTGSDGVARLAKWTLGPVAGPNTLAATSTGLTGSPVTFTATGAAAPVAASVALNDGDGQSATVGVPVATPPSVIVRDQYSNPFPGASVTFAVTGGGGSVTGASQTSGSNGVARVGSWTVGPTAGLNTLAATSAGLTGSPVPFTATGIALPPPPPFGDSEPPPPATVLPIQNYTLGALAGGTSYLYESYDRYTDNGNDATLLEAGNNHYGSTTVRTVYYNTNFFSLVSGRGGSGLAIRSHYATAGNQPLLQTPTGLGSYTGTIVFSYYLRFPDAGGFPSSAGMKFFEMWYANGSHGRIQMGMHGNFHFNPGYTPADHTRAGAEIGYQPVGPYPTALNDGNWHRVTILYRPNTTNATGWNGSSFATASSRDGRAATWIDGVKIIDISAATVGVTPAGGTKVWCTNTDLDTLGGGSGYYIAHNQYPEYVNGLTGPFNLDIDDIKIWTFP